MFRLVERHVTAPSGDEFQRTFVSTPGAVGIVAVTDDNRVVLVSQYRAAVHASVREIPAGMRDVPGEDPLETVKRRVTTPAHFNVWECVCRRQELQIPQWRCTLRLV